MSLLSGEFERLYALLRLRQTKFDYFSHRSKGKRRNVIGAVKPIAMPATFRTLNKCEQKLRARDKFFL